MVVLLLFLNIVLVSGARLPSRRIVEIEEVPFSWCDEDYPIIADSNDTFQADDTYQADINDMALEETS